MVYIDGETEIKILIFCQIVVRVSFQGFNAPPPATKKLREVKVISLMFVASPSHAIIVYAINQRCFFVCVCILALVAVTRTQTGYIYTQIHKRHVHLCMKKKKKSYKFITFMCAFHSHVVGTI